MIPTMIRAIYDNPIGDRVRVITGLKPPINIRPLTRAATVSDLFCWRADQHWETCFELVNLPSLLAPDAEIRDQVSFVLFDANGRPLSEQCLVLSPFECRRLTLSQFLTGRSGYGTFACFHSPASLEILRKSGSYLSERGHVAYKRQGDRIWGYVHGNLHAVARARRGQIHNLGVSTSDVHAYRPQVRFDDVDVFELAYTNPVGQPLDLTLRFLDLAGREVARNETAVPVRGASIIRRENASRDVARVESLSRNALWRPTVFKHYASHFDVFHG